jgi:hypothetical protein
MFSLDTSMTSSAVKTARHLGALALVLFLATFLSHASPALALEKGCWPGQHWNPVTQRCVADICVPPKKIINGKCVLPQGRPSTGGNVALAKCQINPRLPECKPCPPGYKKVNGHCINNQVK